MSYRYRARFGLLAVLIAIPLATAQVAIPSVPSPTTTVDPNAPPSGSLNVQEGPLTVLGPAHAPTLVRVQAPDGTEILEYSVDAEGRARLDVTGENAVADATFVRLEGDPTGDAFRIVLRDAQGGIHEVDVDRVALRAALPPGLPAVTLPDAPIEIERPPAWPSAPQRSYLLHIKDAQNLVPGERLDGTPFLQKAGTHRAVLQIPLHENEWDRWFVQARRESTPGTLLNATFAEQATTESALILSTTYAPSLLNPAEGERILVDIVYEKRLAPVLVERFTEPATHAYRVDGIGPAASLLAPPEANDFRFAVTWSGTDSMSGIGAFLLHYQESGEATWKPWTTTSQSGDTFSGDWGKTYNLRLRALDRVGNPSAEIVATTRIVQKPADVDDVNDPPTARLLQPVAGSELVGTVRIAWQASDKDGTPITSRIEVSDDDGETYRLIYVGPDLATSWNTEDEMDGAGYRIKLTVSDGTQTAGDTASALKVRNIVAPPAPVGNEQTPAAPQAPSAPTSAPTQPGTAGGDEPVAPAADDAGEGGRGIPAPFAGIAIGAAALLLARRRRA